jgi:hypothetical protein
MRTISNTGDPIVDLKGNPIAGCVVEFKLVDSDHRYTSVAYVSATGERIGNGTATATCDANGIFSISLYCNDALTTPSASATMYRCKVNNDQFSVFYASLPTGGTALSFADFYSSSTALTAGQIASVPMGEVSYFDTTGAAITIASTSDGSTNLVKVLATTTGDFYYNTDNGGSDNARLRYTGSATKTFNCQACLSILPATAADSVVIGFAKNGTVSANHKVIQTLGTTSETQVLALNRMIELATNDYVEIYIGNLTAGNNVTVKSLNLFMLGV